jgi:hypothetical protein
VFSIRRIWRSRSAGLAVQDGPDSANMADGNPRVMHRSHGVKLSGPIMTARAATCAAVRCNPDGVIGGNRPSRGSMINDDDRRVLTTRVPESSQNGGVFKSVSFGPST